MIVRVKEAYQDHVRPALKERFEYSNDMAVPTIQKVVVSMGLGKTIAERGRMDAAKADLARITGQQPVVRLAKVSVAQFRLRQGMPIGLMVTLRGDRMYAFLDRLISVGIPRIRDFRGFRPKLDGTGNYNMGLEDQTIFPEIDLAALEYSQGMNVTVVTTARTDEEGLELLRGLGFPFRET